MFTESISRDISASSSLKTLKRGYLVKLFHFFNVVNYTYTLALTDSAVPLSSIPFCH